MAHKTLLIVMDISLIFRRQGPPDQKKLFVLSKNSLRAGDDVYTVSPRRLPVAFDEVDMDLAQIREVN